MWFPFSHLHYTNRLHIEHKYCLSFTYLLHYCAAHISRHSLWLTQRSPSLPDWTFLCRSERLAKWIRSSCVYVCVRACVRTEHALWLRSPTRPDAHTAKHALARTCPLCHPHVSTTQRERWSNGNGIQKYKSARSFDGPQQQWHYPVKIIVIQAEEAH